jgi:hypothetical protein
MLIIRLVLHHNDDVIYVLHHNLQHFRIINTSTRPNTYLVSICGIGIPKSIWQRNQCLGIYFHDCATKQGD